MADVLQFPPGGPPPPAEFKSIEVPAHWPLDVDEIVIRLEEVSGLLDILSDQLKDSEQSVTLTALRLVHDAQVALFGPRDGRP